MLTGLAASRRAPYDLLLVPPWSPPPWRQLSRSRPVCLPFASGAVQTPPPAHALHGDDPGTLRRLSWCAAIRPQVLFLALY